MSVANLYDAIISLKQAADTISDIGGRSERDQADLMRCIAKDAMSEYHEISKVWSDFQAFKRIKSDAYDQYVTRDREPKYDSCSCHLSAPCSYCTRDADEETKGHVLPAPLTKHCASCPSRERVDLWIGTTPIGMFAPKILLATGLIRRKSL